MKRSLVILTTIFVVTPIVIWLCFSGDGFIPAGKNLDVKDWLYFWGVYLGVISTTVLSVVILYQNNKFRKLSYKQNIKFQKLSDKRLLIENKPELILMHKNEYLFRKHGYFEDSSYPNDLHLIDYLEISLADGIVELEHSDNKLNLRVVQKDKFKVYMVANCGNNTGNSIDIKCNWKKYENNRSLPVFLPKDYVYPIVFKKKDDTSFTECTSVVNFIITYCDIFGKKMSNSCEIELGSDRITYETSEE